MSKPRFAVVRDTGTTYIPKEYRFAVWHELEHEAVEEAMRLCRKEKATFIVLKEIVRYSVKEIPIEVDICQEDKK